MRNVLRKMRALLREPQRGAVGVSLTDGGICLACLAGTEEFQRREETLHLPLPPTEAKESLWQEAAGVIQVALAKRGWEKSRIAVCLTEDEVFSYSREFPPLSEREMREATRWDLLASLPDAREEAAYSLDFQRVGEREVVLAALPREKVREIHRAFSHAGLCLASLCFLPTGAGRQVPGTFAADGMNLAADDLPQEEDGAAFLAAQELLSREKNHLELLPESMRPADWAFGRLAALVAGIFFFCMASIYGWNAWRIHELQGVVQKNAHEMMLLSAERARMEQEAQEDGRAAQKERQLISLSKGALPCRSLLVHFGTRTVEGAWIRGLRVVDGHAVELEGAATSYDALADFVRVLEEDKGFFRAAPVLKKSERKQEAAGGSLVYFSLELKI